MKNMLQAKEFLNAPPPGKYPAQIVELEPGFSNAGSSMITVTVEFRNDKNNGEQTKDYILTDGAVKGGGIGKRKLRGLGVPVDSNAEIDDQVICQKLQGLNVFVTIGNEQMMGRENPEDEKSPYTKPLTTFDEQGRTVPLMKATVLNYSLTNVGTTVQAPQQTQAAPAAPAQGFQAQAPQGGFAAPAQGFAAPAAPVAQAPQGWGTQAAAAAPAPAAAGPWAAQPAFTAPAQAAPQGQWPAQANQATPPWNGQQAAAPSAPSGKRGKKQGEAEG